MALIVEDGSGVSGAESYLSVALADAYWTYRNDSVWNAYATAKKEAALRAATQYIDATYKFNSTMSSATQALEWPRASFYGVSGRYYGGTEIPQSLKDAVAELAYEWGVNGALLPTADRGNDIKRVKAGSVEVEYNSSAPTVKTFNFVSRLLSDLTKGGNSGVNVRLERV